MLEGAGLWQCVSMMPYAPKTGWTGDVPAKKNGQTNKIHLSIRFGGASGVEPWHRSPGLSHFESLKLLDEAGSSRLSLAAEGILVTSKRHVTPQFAGKKSAAFCEMTLEKAFFTQVVSGCISGVLC